MQRCPPEILQEIIGYLACDYEDEAIRTMALLCRSTRHVAQAQIFRSIELNSMDSCEFFLYTAIDENPALYMHVRNLRLNDADASYALIGWLCGPDGFRLCSRFISVTQLSLWNIQFVGSNVTTTRISDVFLSFVSVETLNIHRCHFHDFEILQALLISVKRSLQHLRITETTWDPEKLQGMDDSSNTPDLDNELDSYAESSDKLRNLKSLMIYHITQHELALWLLRNGTADVILEWTIKLSVKTDNETAAAFLSRGLNALRSLVIDTESLLWTNNTPARGELSSPCGLYFKPLSVSIGLQAAPKLNLTKLQSLKSIRFTSLYYDTWTTTLTTMGTLPVNNVIEDIEISLLVINVIQWDAHWIPGLAKLDLQLAKQFRKLKHLSIRSRCNLHGKRIEDIAETMPLTRERGVLRIIIL
jgi:hypothetical protein